MSKSEAILKIEPENELRFKGPFKEPVSVVMKLTNTAEKKVCFKVKTTAPKRYCVKPTTGTIDPKGAVTILVTLQPFDPNDPNEKGKHKFQVLSVIAPEGDYNIETLWKETSLEINDWKLKCVLEFPEEGTNNATSTTVPSANNLVSAPTVSSTTAAAPTSIMKSDDKHSNVSTDKISGLETELRKATQEINRLREEVSGLTKENIQLKEEGLRLRRNIASGGSDSSSGFKTELPSSSIHRPLSAHQQDSMSAVSPNVLYIVAALLLGIIIAKLVF